MKIYLLYGLLFSAWITLISFSARNLLRKSLQHLCIALLVFLTVIFMWMSSEPSHLFRDFKKAYFPAGRIILENHENLYYSTKVLGGFVYLPIIALLFTPFSYMNSSHAQYLFSALGLLAILSTLFLLFRPKKLHGWKAAAIIGLFAVNGPLCYSFRLGNTTHFILPILVLVFLCIGTGRLLQAGILLAIAAIIKIPLFLFVGYLALRRYWTALAGFGITVLVILAASLFLFGIPLHQNWLSDWILSFEGKAMGGFNLQSIDSFLVRFLRENDATNWNLIPIDSYFRFIRYSLLVILFLLAAGICSSKAPDTAEEKHLELSIVLCLMLVASPVSWTHYYLLLLLPFSLYLQNRLSVPEGKVWLGVFALIVLSVSPPIIRGVSLFKFGYWLLDFLFSRFFVSHYLIGALSFLGMLLVARRRATACDRGGIPQSGYGML